MQCERKHVRFKRSAFASKRRPRQDQPEQSAGPNTTSPLPVTAPSTKPRYPLPNHSPLYQATVPFAKPQPPLASYGTRFSSLRAAHATQNVIKDWGSFDWFDQTHPVLERSSFLFSYKSCSSVIYKAT